MRDRDLAHVIALVLHAVHPRPPLGSKVVVDDLLPVDRKGRLLCACSSDPSELWVSIIEKAYMKVHGGYDFPGSNSGIDLYALTGWIPEHVRTRDPDFDGDRTWERMRSGVHYGDCLITIATGPLSAEEEERWGLVPEHAYAVLDVREHGGTRLLQVKNPWSHSRWRGPYSVEDAAKWTPELRAALQYDPVRGQRGVWDGAWVATAPTRRTAHSLFPSSARRGAGGQRNILD